MKLTDETQRGTNFIRAYEAGEIRVGERAIRNNCIVTADQILDWSPKSVDGMTLADVEPLLELAPEIVILGTGAMQRFPSPAVIGAVLSRGIGCEVMTTGAACRTYNVLVGEDRKVVAALLLE